MPRSNQATTVAVYLVRQTLSGAPGSSKVMANHASGVVGSVVEWLWCVDISRKGVLGGESPLVGDDRVGKRLFPLG